MLQYTKNDLLNDSLDNKIANIIRDCKNDIGAIIFIKDSCNLKDFWYIIAKIKEIPDKNYYIHWEADMSYKEFDEITEIPHEIASMSFDVQQIYNLDNG